MFCNGVGRSLLSRGQSWKAKKIFKTNFLQTLIEYFKCQVDRHLEHFNYLDNPSCDDLRYLQSNFNLRSWHQVDGNEHFLFFVAFCPRASVAAGKLS